MRQLPHMRGQSPKAGGQDKGTGRGFLLQRLLGLGSQASGLVGLRIVPTPLPGSQLSWAAHFSSPWTVLIAVGANLTLPPGTSRPNRTRGVAVA